MNEYVKFIAFERMSVANDRYCSFQSSKSIQGKRSKRLSDARIGMLNYFIDKYC